jgi:hypothetical protein
VKLEDLETQSNNLLSIEQKEISEHGSYDIILLFRRLIILHLTLEDTVLPKDIDRCFSYLLKVMTLQQQLKKDQFEVSKIAIMNTFKSFFKESKILIPGIFKFIDRECPFMA